MKKALLIVDVQNGFINDHTKHIPEMVEHAQKDYEHVIITKFYNDEDSPYRSLIKWDKCAIGSDDIHLAFKAKEGAFIVEKVIYSCVNNKFLSYMKDNEISVIDICGIDTDVCVTKCAVDIFEHNLVPRVLAHMCASNEGKEFHKFALKILRRYIGKGQVIDGS